MFFIGLGVKNKEVCLGNAGKRGVFNVWSCSEDRRVKGKIEEEMLIKNGSRRRKKRQKNHDGEIILAL